VDFSAGIGVFQQEFSHYWPSASARVAPGGM